MFMSAQASIRRGQKRLCTGTIFATPRLPIGKQSLSFPPRGRALCCAASVAQRQSTGFVNRWLWVQIPPLAFVARWNAVLCWCLIRAPVPVRLSGVEVSSSWGWCGAGPVVGLACGYSGSAGVESLVVGECTSVAKRFGGIPEWPKGPDCKSGGSAFAGSNPAPAIICFVCVTWMVRCGCSSMVELQPSKLVVWVRFPSPALRLTCRVKQTILCDAVYLGWLALLL